MIKNPLTHLGIAALLVLIALGGYWFAHHTLIVRSESSAALLNSIATTRQAIDTNEDAARRLENVEKDRNAIRGYFISADDVVGFLESLEDEGKAFSAVVSVVSVSQAPAPRPHLVVALKITGAFASILRTVGAIEYGPHDIEVTALTLDTDTTESGAKTWRATMTLSVGMASTTTNLPPKP